MKKQRLITLLLTATLATTSLLAAPREKNNILSLKQTITDDDIVFPESFDTDVYKLMTNWYLQNYAVLDADVENKSHGEVSEETYIRRLAAIPSVIEMPYNQVVRKHIERYVYRSRTLVEEMLGMSLYYMPIFEQALEKEGLPLELKYLPIVESALDPNAVSRVGAAGLWQFMVGTGKGLGLEINSLVDERRDPYRSSAMAAKYLKNLYQIYNDWSLAIAAYNCGPGNVNKALHRKGDAGDFWDIYDELPRETRGYVPAFIAANYAMTYYKQHNISPSLASKPLITDTVSVNRRIHFAQIAQVLNIPIEEIRTLNPQYRADVIPGDNHPYTLVLPSQQVYSFIMSEDSIDNYRDDLYAHREVVEPGGRVSTAEEYISGRAAFADMRTINHKVGRGETLASIADKYGMTTSDLMALNNMSNERVRRGDNLKVKAPEYNNASADNEDIIPVTSDQSTGSDFAMEDTGDNNEQQQFDEVKNIERQAAEKAPYKGSYTAKSDIQPTTTRKSSVKNDDQTTRQRASRANTDNWRKRNERYTSSRDNGKHKRDDKSRKKEETSHSSKSRKGKKSSKPEQPSEVTVKKGESLTKIAEKAGVTVKDIERANGIENGNKIKAGEKIKIPTKAEAKQAASAEKKGGKGKASKDNKSSGKSSKSSSTSKSSKSSKSSSSSKSSKSGSSSKKSKKK